MARGTASASLSEFLGKGNCSGTFSPAVFSSSFPTAGWSFVFRSCFIFSNPWLSTYFRALLMKSRLAYCSDFVGFFLLLPPLLHLQPLQGILGGAFLH